MALDDYDDDFPTATAGRGNTLDLAKLPDGEYTLAVKAMEVKEGTSAGDIISLKLELLTDGPFFGSLVEKAYFMSKNENGIRVKNANQLVQVKDDLKRLGFDTDNWTKEQGRPFSREIKRACAVVVGVTFKGKKKQGGAKNGGGYYQNLYVNDRIPDDGKPEAFGPKEMDDANADPFG